MSNKKLTFNTLRGIDVVQGKCEECDEHTVLVSIVSDYYRCTNCGYDMRQYINGSIKYLPLSEEEKTWLKSQNSE